MLDWAKVVETQQNIILILFELIKYFNKQRELQNIKLVINTAKEKAKLIETAKQTMPLRVIYVTGWLYGEAGL